MNALRQKSFRNTSRLVATLAIVWILLQFTPVTGQWGGGGGGGGGLGSRWKSLVVPPYIHNALDIITPVSFRVATNFKPHFPHARIPHTDVALWGGLRNPWIWSRVLNGPGKDPYTGYFIY